MKLSFTQKIFLLFSLFALATASAVAQANQWAWMKGNNTFLEPGVYGTKGTPDAANNPGARFEAQTWSDASGNFWLFGGLGFDINGDYDLLNDFWKYNPATNEWTWMTGDNSAGSVPEYGTRGVSAPANTPGPRAGAVTWTDAAGNLWMFGGYGIDNDWFDGWLNDLWKYNPSTNQWTWMKGDDESFAAGKYGTKGVVSSKGTPGARELPVSWTDGSGNLWLFGGIGVDGFYDLGYLNDLWKYNTATNQWTWMSGSNFGDPTGDYGTQGVPDAGNTPGGRFGHVSWKDANGNLWLFGGSGLDGVGDDGFLSDLWRYNTVTNQWTWVKGDNTIDEPSVYGTQGTPSAANKPGGKFSSVSWTDAGGNLWLFGGTDEPENGDEFNDLWMYNPNTNAWTWMKGDDVFNFGGVYGSPGVANAAYTPGGRELTVPFTDGSGNLWLFSGLGYDVQGQYGPLNDLWKYATPPSLPAASALNFDGVDDEVMSQNAISIGGSEARTVELWAKYATDAPDNCLLFSWGSSGTGSEFGLTSSQRQLQFFGGGTADFTTSYIIDDNWHHYAVTYNGSVVKIYVDGVLIDNQPRTLTTETAPFHLGYGNIPAVYAFKGEMDEFRIWDRALCQAEIVNNMNCQLKGTESNLVTYYPFNQGNVGADNTVITQVTDAKGLNPGNLNSFTLTGTESNFVDGIVSNTTCAAFVPPALVVTCPTDVREVISVLDPANPCSRITSFAAPVYDECIAANMTWRMSGASGETGTGFIPSSHLYNVGKTKVVYKIQSGNQRAVCSNVVTVVDGVKPFALNPPTDYSVDPSPRTACQASVAFTDLDIVENCGIRTMKWSMSGATVAAGTGQIGTKTLNAGITKVKYILRDVGNNAYELCYRVTVNDYGDPIVDVTDMQSCNNAIKVTAPVITDCSATTVEWTMHGATRMKGRNEVGTQTFNDGITTIVYKVTDFAGNTTIKTQTISAGPDFCIRSTPITSRVTLAPPTATDNVKGLQLKLSPNPTIHFFELRVQSPAAEEMQVGIYNSEGQQVAVMKGLPGQTIRFGENLQAGTYMIEVRQGERRATVVGVKNNK